MSNYKVLSDETFEKQMEKLRMAILASASGEGGLAIDSFDDLNLLVRMGEAQKFLEVGDQIEVERANTLTASIGESTGITAVKMQNEQGLIENIGSNLSGTFVLHFDGNAWRNEVGASVTLSNWGISVTGTPIENDEIIINITANALTFDILDFNKYAPRDTRLQNCIVLGMHDVFTYGTIPFSAQQLMYCAVNGLPAGTYKFTLDHARYANGTEYDGTYMFTITQPIPANGGFRHTNNIGGYKASYAKSDVLGNYITTYNPVSAGGSAIQSGITVTEWDDSTVCTDLGTFTSQKREYYTEDDTVNGGKRNFTERQAYGSNRWRDSVYRQWLNSDAGAVPSNDTTTISKWWKPATVWDRIPGGAKSAGFLHGLDKEFVDALGEVEVKTTLAPCDVVGDVKLDITYDKIFLQSRKDIFGSDEVSGVSEGSQLEYWKNKGNADRIKYQNGTARYWWLRTPYSAFAYGVRGVYTSGGLNYFYAYTANGVVPACCICGKQVIKNEN